MVTRLAFITVHVTLIVWMTASAASAHHSFASEFDINKPVKFEGTLVRVEWVNPHSWLHFDVKKPDGTTERWMIEGGTPNTLFRRGVTREALKPGMVILVQGYQAKDGALRASGQNVTLPNGQTLFMGSASADAPPERPR